MMARLRISDDCGRPAGSRSQWRRREGINNNNNDYDDMYNQYNDNKYNDDNNSVNTCNELNTNRCMNRCELCHSYPCPSQFVEHLCRRNMVTAGSLQNSFWQGYGCEHHGSGRA